MKLCRAGSCNLKSRAFGFCYNHYIYAKKHGEEKAINYVVKQYSLFKPCKYDGCLSSYYAKGYCSKHYGTLVRRGIAVKNYRPHTQEADGRSAHPLLGIYNNMLWRCYNKKAKKYKYYGNRGIKVCSEWKNNFWQFVSDMGERPFRYSLDRINNDGDYSAANCRWASYIEQSNNRAVTFLLTPSNLAKATGFSCEIIRQWAGLGKTKRYPVPLLLVPFVISKYKIGKNTRVIFNNKAIDFLKERAKCLK